LQLTEEIQQEENKQAEDASQSETTTTETTKREKSEYKAAKDDQVDEMIAKFMNRGRDIQIKRIDWGKYAIAGLKMNIRIVNGRLVARVGGGWMRLEELMARYEMQQDKMAAQQSSTLPTAQQVEKQIQKGEFVKHTGQWKNIETKSVKSSAKKMQAMYEHPVNASVRSIEHETTQSRTPQTESMQPSFKKDRQRSASLKPGAVLQKLSNMKFSTSSTKLVTKPVVPPVTPSSSTPSSTSTTNSSTTKKSTLPVGKSTDDLKEKRKSFG